MRSIVVQQAGGSITDRVLMLKVCGCSWVVPVDATFHVLPFVVFQGRQGCLGSPEKKVLAAFSVFPEAEVLCNEAAK